MKLALAQMKLAPTEEENLQHALDMVQQAAQRGAELILFPELQLTPFFPQYAGRDMHGAAHTLGDDTLQALAAACRRLHLWAAPNVYLQQGAGYYDASLLIDAGGVTRGISKMVHITQAPLFYEQDYYTPAEDGFHVYDTPWGKVGIVICFDRHLPESIRTCAALGADLILIPTANTEGEPMELFEWELRVQAMQSSVWVAMCNRTGREDAMLFNGQSLVIDPHGNVATQTGSDETLLLCDVDLAAAAALRGQNPYFTLRRPGCYR